MQLSISQVLQIHLVPLLFIPNLEPEGVVEQEELAGEGNMADKAVMDATQVVKVPMAERVVLEELAGTVAMVGMVETVLTVILLLFPHQPIAM